MTRSERDGQSAPSAMRRMRRYTTITLCVTVAVIVGVPLSTGGSVPLLLAMGLGGAAAIVMAVFWEEPAPRWVSIGCTVLALGGWSVVLAARGAPMAATASAFVLTILATHHRRHRWPAAIVGAALILAPVGVAALLAPDAPWTAYALSAIGAYGFLWILLRFNDYGWGLFLQLDEARRTERELAVVQERYRMAADLHDIQGHTLHVIRLTMQVARRMIPTDPDAAARQLETAEALVVQTLADTKALVSGDRVVSIAHELANATALFEAAGIKSVVAGATPPDADELLALLLRESTTNILRHAQATRVRINLGADRIVVVNDGAVGALRPGGGLTRLAERFEQHGGHLTAAMDRGEFRVEGRLP